MEGYSDAAIEIINELHTERLLKEAKAMNLTVTLKQLEKGWRSEWKFDPGANDWNVGGYVCGKCGSRNNNLPTFEVALPEVFVGANFCPECGAPMTDLAVDAVMKNLEALNNGKSD